MKQIVTLMAIMFLWLSSSLAQDYEVKYDYDQSGNRLRRRTITITVPKATVEGKKSLKPVEEKWAERKVTVFPNPTKGNLSISIMDGKEEQAYRYVLYSMSGQILKKGKFFSNGRHGIPLDGYKAGIYLLQLHDGEDKLDFRILKE